ncbi:hypothetical protein [Treponema vincentii]|uniref:hypothetical protein n=1 Tax=Treponema vincentii TaxID=69710 RepID=UPI0020A48BF1|nr:hypothetical protein [Treponema vincentii]
MGKAFDMEETVIKDEDITVYKSALIQALKHRPYRSLRSKQDTWSSMRRHFAMIYRNC